MFYTYELINPTTKLPFYVGKGSGKRMYIHECRAKHDKWRGRNMKLFHTIMKILNSGLHIEYKKTLETLNEQLAFDKEIKLIATYRKKGMRLCNFTNGGEGTSGGGWHWSNVNSIKEMRNKLINVPKSKLHRKHMSESRMGYKMPIETRNKLRKYHLGLTKYNVELVEPNGTLHKFNGLVSCRRWLRMYNKKHRLIGRNQIGHNALLTIGKNHLNWVLIKKEKK